MGSLAVAFLPGSLAVAFLPGSLAIALPPLAKLLILSPPCEGGVRGGVLKSRSSALFHFPPILFPPEKWPFFLCFQRRTELEGGNFAVFSKVFDTPG